MNFKENLNNVLLYHEIMGKNIKKDYKMSDYPELKELLARSFKPYVNNTYLVAEEVVNNLGRILQLTSFSNMEWLKNKEIYMVPGFKEKLIEVIGDYPYESKVDILLICMAEFSEEHERFYTEELIERVITTRKTDKSFCQIFNHLSPSKKVFFLQTLLNNKIKFDITYFELDIKSRVYLNDHIEEFIPLNTDILSLVTYFKRNKEVISKINNYFRNHIDLLVKSITKESCITEYNDKIIELVELIIKDIILNERANASEIEWLEGGSYSEVLVIKNKVIKFGNDRGTRTFPNNPYILQPLLRKTFTVDNQNIFIEVTEKANVKEDFTADDLYDIYKKLRKIGLIWADVSEDNIGRLRKSNKIHWHGNLNPSDETLELEAYREGPKLKVGDIVLTDADLIYKEDDDELKKCGGRYWQTFEKKYQKELSETKVILK